MTNKKTKKVRGSSWDFRSVYLHSACRFVVRPVRRNGSLGFRVVCFVA